MNIGEQLLSDLAGYISELVPINVNEVKNRLSVITSKYYIQKVEDEETHPDLQDKIQLFLSSKRLEGLSPLTLKGYKLELDIFAEKMKKMPNDITAADIRSFLGQYPDLKMSTIGRKLSVLKSFFGWLAGEDLIERDPTAKLKAPSRLAEVHQLNRSHINFQSMSTRVIGKGNKEREVYLSFKSLYHLKKYLQSRTDDNDALMVTVRQPYRRLTKRGIQREIAAIAKNAGLEKRVSPHVLRHTFATLTLNNGAELVAIQELLGHSSPDTTLRYARITEERKREQHKKFLIQ